MRWYVIPDHVGAPAGVMDEDGNGICDCLGDNAQANARLIVEAVNTYPRLAKALEACKALIDADALFLQADEKWLSGHDECEIAARAMARQAEAAKLAREALEMAEDCDVRKENRGC